MRPGCSFNAGAMPQKMLKAVHETKATFCNAQNLEHSVGCAATLGEQLPLFLVILNLSSP